MDCKITVTTRCGAQCATCPSWRSPQVDMSPGLFAVVWAELMRSHEITKVLVNSTGDMTFHPRYPELYEIMRTVPARKWIAFTTNGAALHEVPPVHELIISFNGGTKEAYERTAGLDFDQVVRNVKSLYPEIAKIRAEIHCLMWEGNAGTEDDLLKLWQDFPGKVRVSYKYDNQFGPDKGAWAGKPPAYRVPCDYLGMLIVWADGSVIQCSHDFNREYVWGIMGKQSIQEILGYPDRVVKVVEHMGGVFTGLCEKCNYNTPIGERIRYLKE